jgi:hypothetical protein
VEEWEMKPTTRDLVVMTDECYWDYDYVDEKATQKKIDDAFSELTEALRQADMKGYLRGCEEMLKTIKEVRYKDICSLGLHNLDENKICRFCGEKFDVVWKFPPLCRKSRQSEKEDS